MPNPTRASQFSTLYSTPEEPLLPGLAGPSSVEEEWVLSPWGRGVIPSGMRGAVPSPYSTGRIPIRQTLPFNGGVGNSPYIPQRPAFPTKPTSYTPLREGIPNAFEGAIPAESNNAFAGLANYAPKAGLGRRILGGLGKAGEVGMVASLGNSVLEALAPSTQYYTPADIGSYLYDKMFGSNNASAASAKDATQIPSSNVGIPGELASLAAEGRKQTLAFGKNAKKKASNGISGKFKKTLTTQDLSGMQELPQIPEPTTMDLPDKLPSRDLTGTIELSNKSDMLPDRQQSGPQSAFDRYMDLVSNMPARDDYRPSIGRKIIAGLVGAATGFGSGGARGYQIAQDIVGDPYNQAVGKWGTQLEELKPLMVAENQREMNQTRVSEQARKTDLINQTKIVENDIKRLAAEGKIKNDADRIRVQQAIAEARQYLMNGQLELGKEKLDEVREFHQGLLGVAKSNAASNVTRAAAASANAESYSRNVESQIKHRSAQDIFNDIMQEIANKNKEKK